MTNQIKTITLSTGTWVLQSQPPAPIPVDIVERLKEANSFTGGEEVQMKYGFEAAVIKLKEILSTQTDKEVKP